MIIGRFIAYVALTLLAFALLAVGALGCVHIGGMLDVADTAPYAKAVIICGGIGVVVLAIVGWWDASHDGGGR
jgi:hypothetical protein